MLGINHGEFCSKYTSMGQNLDHVNETPTTETLWAVDLEEMKNIDGLNDRIKYLEAKPIVWFPKLLCPNKAHKTQKFQWTRMLSYFFFLPCPMWTYMLEWVLPKNRDALDLANCLLQVTLSSFAATHTVFI